MDNEKKSKIRVCKFISEWAGPSGTVYYHEIHLENGDSGQIGAKEKYPSKLEPDQELTYTIESTSRGNKIKAVSQSGGGFKGGRQQQEPKVQFIGFAARYTIDFLIAHKLPADGFNNTFDMIYHKMISKL